MAASARRSAVEYVGTQVGNCPVTSFTTCSAGRFRFDKPPLGRYNHGVRKRLATGLVLSLLFFTSLGAYGFSAPCACQKLCPCCTKAQPNHRRTVPVPGNFTQAKVFVGNLKSLPATLNAEAVRSQRLSPSETAPCGQFATHTAVQSEMQLPRVDDGPPLDLVAIHAFSSLLICFSQGQSKPLIPTGDDHLSTVLRI